MLSVSVNHYAAGLSQPRHAHAETTVTFMLSGSLSERVGAVEEIAQPLSIVIKPRDTEHANVFSKDVRTLQIMLTEVAASEAERWQRNLRKWRWNHASSAVPHFMQLLRTVRSNRVQEVHSEKVQQAAHEALASLAEPDGGVCGEPPRWLATVREMLDDSDAVLSVQTLAASADVHPVYLARQFRRWYGCSITQLSRRRRMQRAAAVITATSDSLSAIAHATGYADQAHMCRMFAREAGVTPTMLRRLTTG